MKVAHNPITTVSKAFNYENQGYGRAVILEGTMKGQSVTARYADGTYQVVDITKPKTPSEKHGFLRHPHCITHLPAETKVRLSDYEAE